MDRANGKHRLKAVASAPGAGTVLIPRGNDTATAVRGYVDAPVIAEGRLLADECGLGLSGTVPKLAAERPDAAQRGWDQVLRAVAHAAVLLCVVGFVAVYCVWSPLAGRLRHGADAATVLVVADAPVEIRAPAVGGVFRASRPLAPGAAVSSGQVLGRVESATLETELARASAQLAAMQVQRLRLEEAARTGGGATTPGNELASVDARLAAATEEVERLVRLRGRLLVRAPADGVVPEGMAATADVAAGARIASVVPAGSTTHAEVTAPLEVLNELQRRGVVVVEFHSPGGVVTSSAVPLPGSVRHFLKEGPGRRDEVWGVLRCAPAHTGGELIPGAIGRLAW
jgi:hypothetical protein